MGYTNLLFIVHYTKTSKKQSNKMQLALCTKTHRRLNVYLRDDQRDHGSELHQYTPLCAFAVPYIMHRDQAHLYLAEKDFIESLCNDVLMADLPYINGSARPDYTHLNHGIVGIHPATAAWVYTRHGIPASRIHTMLQSEDMITQAKKFYNELNLTSARVIWNTGIGFAMTAVCPYMEKYFQEYSKVWDMSHTYSTWLDNMTRAQNEWQQKCDELVENMGSPEGYAVTIEKFLQDEFKYEFLTAEDWDNFFPVFHAAIFRKAAQKTSFTGDTLPAGLFSNKKLRELLKPTGRNAEVVLMMMVHHHERWPEEVMLHHTKTNLRNFITFIQQDLTWLMQLLEALDMYSTSVVMKFGAWKTFIFNSCWIDKALTYRKLVILFEATRVRSLWSDFTACSVALAPAIWKQISENLVSTFNEYFKSGECVDGKSVPKEFLVALSENYVESIRNHSLPPNVIQQLQPIATTPLFDWTCEERKYISILDAINIGMGVDKLEYPEVLRDSRERCRLRREEHDRREAQRQARLLEAASGPPPAAEPDARPHDEAAAPGPSETDTRRKRKRGDEPKDGSDDESTSLPEFPPLDPEAGPASSDQELESPPESPSDDLSIDPEDDNDEDQEKDKPATGAAASVSEQPVAAILRPPSAGDEEGKAGSMDVKEALPENDFTEQEQSDHGFEKLGSDVWNVIFQNLLNEFLNTEHGFSRACAYQEGDTIMPMPEVRLWQPDKPIPKKTLQVLLANYLIDNSVNIPVCCEGPSTTLRSRAVAAAWCGALFPLDCPFRKVMIGKQRAAWKCRSKKGMAKMDSFKNLAQAIAWDIARKNDCNINKALSSAKRAHHRAAEFFKGFSST